MHDSIDKIISVYFQCVTKEEFTWKNKVYKPKPLTVSPNIFRGLICSDNCGGCCFVFSLDYLGNEQKPDIKLETRDIMFKDKKMSIYSDIQGNVKSHHCGQMSKNGRCNIHENSPFSCDFELIRFLVFSGERPNILTSRLYGRGWNMLRCDNIRGALCKMVEPTEGSKTDTILKLYRLAQWCDYFGLSHKVYDIIKWADKGTEKITI